MNLFWLSLNMRRNPRYHCDQHMKMSLEAVQLLYTAWWILVPSGEWRQNTPLNVRGTHGYLPTHENNSLAVWVRESRDNYLLCVEYALQICYEYTKRYHREHASQIHAEWMRDNVPPMLASLGITPIPLALKEKTMRKAPTMRDAVKAYREFYKTKTFARYNHSKKPKWFK